jgi:hypothetical protein
MPKTRRPGADWTGFFRTVENYGGRSAPNGDTVGATDQRSKIGTFNIAPSWTHLASTNAIFTLGAFVRRDDYNYYPSSDPFADLGPPSLQRQSVGQNRTLTNTGIRSDLSYVKGVNNIKAGVTYEQTFLNENDTIGIVDPTYNAPCITFSAATESIRSRRPDSLPRSARQRRHLPSKPARQCYRSLECARLRFYPYFNPVLAPYDLTRGGSPYAFNGHTDVKELALYVRDAITVGQMVFEPRHARRFLQRSLHRASRPSLVSGSLTTSRRRARFSAFPMRARWNLPSMKI